MKTHSFLPFAIVIGLDSYTGIQAARILAFRNIPTIGISCDPKHPYSRTRVCKKKYYVDTNSEEFIKLLEKVGPDLKNSVLFPAHDRAVHLVSQHRQRLENWYHIILPKHEIVDTLMDKVRFYSFSKEKGLPIPLTFIIKGKNDLLMASNEVSYPCIVKPSKKTDEWLRETGSKVFMVHSASELKSLYEKVSDLSDLLVVQQWIEGDESNLFSFNGYFDKKTEPKATFIARKTRQWPPLIGVSSSGVECKNDVVLKEAINLFQITDYQGLGYLEMKLEERTGKHYIIEANIGRPTGRSSIAEAGGVEMLSTMFYDALDMPLPRDRFQSYGGIKWIYLSWDFLAALDMWSQKKLSVRGWWDSIRGPKVYAVLSIRDPLPGLFDLWRMKWTLLSSFLNAVRKRMIASV